MGTYHIILTTTGAVQSPEEGKKEKRRKTILGKYGLGIPE